MLKKIRDFFHSPFSESFWIPTAYESDYKYAVLKPWKEELKDWRFWLVIGIILAIVYIARHYGNFSPVDIRDWHYG